MRLPLFPADNSATATLHDRPVEVVWTRSAARQLAGRPRPLVLELELYFSCLVKKFVHFHDEAPGRETARVTDKIHLFFRAVTSTACAPDVAERLGRQPETELQTRTVRALAPRRVRLDYARGAWKAEFWM